MNWTWTIAILYFLGMPVSKLANTEVAHDFHLSMCEIEYNAENRALEIGLKIFIDDLETALEQYGIKKLRIGTARESKKANKFIGQYLQDNFKIKTTEQDYTYTFIGKELSEDLIAIWCYLEVENMELPRQLTITNAILTEVFDDQSNIINIEVNNQNGYLTLNRSKTSETVTFE